MNIADSLQGVTLLFLDSAPVIYYVEENTQYLPVVDTFFERISNGLLNAVTSPVTLAECLVIPYRQGQVLLQEAFIEIISNGENTLFVPIDDDIACQAASIRARYNLSLSDALQVAVALSSNCRAFLTNDVMLKRVTELRVLVLDELEP